MFLHSSSFWRIEGFMSASRINTPQQGNWTSLLLNKPQGCIIRYLSKGQMRCSQHFGCQVLLVPEQMSRSNKHCRKQRTSDMIWAGFKALNLLPDSERYICQKNIYILNLVKSDELEMQKWKLENQLSYRHWHFRIGGGPDLQSQSISVWQAEKETQKKQLSYRQGL